MNYIEIAQAAVAERYPLIVEAYNTPKSELKKLIPPGTIMGSFAYSIPGKARYMLAPVELAPGVTPNDAVRAWLRDQYKFPIKRRIAQIYEKSYNAPSFAWKGNWGECVYLDLHKAYCHILQLGFNLEYERGKYIACDPRPVPTEIRQAKLAYSAAVSMSNPILSHISIMGHDHQEFTTSPMNMFSNPCLFHLAQDTLNAIGSELLHVLKGHIFYYNTDGCLIDCDYVDYAMDIIHSWGFRAKIKHRGSTRVYNSASWDCGADNVGIPNYQTNEIVQGKLMSKEERLWLKLRWQKWLHYFLKYSEQDFQP